MPTSSSAATIEKKKTFRVQHHLRSVDHNETQETGKNLLKIGSALPSGDRKNPYVRSHSTLNASSITKVHESVLLCDPVTLHNDDDGKFHVSRSQKEKEKHPDRISLDRRGLTALPIINDEPRLRLLSLQHNLVNNLDSLSQQQFPFLVFLDLYDNQLDQIGCLECLENLRVLLMGKNRIRKIEGLINLRKIEVLDLHGNQIPNVSGLSSLSELKVLNLAGNQIRNMGSTDLQGLLSLQELNLRRNKLRKLQGFAETPNLTKLFISNNDLQSVEDISSIANSPNIKEISIDNNPVSLGGDCISFLVSYLPQLVKLNTMQITEQVRKAANAWRRNKENSNTTFSDLTSDLCLNVRREEVISNARTNWELLRSQTKCLANNLTTVDKTIKNLKPDSDFILTPLANKPNNKNVMRVKSKSFLNLPTKVPVLSEKKLMLTKTFSQDTENSQNTSSSNTSSNEFFRLPPILVPIINKMEQKNGEQSKESSVRLSESLSSVGPNVDSSVSSLGSGSERPSSSESSNESDSDSDRAVPDVKCREETAVETEAEVSKDLEINVQESNERCTDASSNLSVNTSTSIHTAQSTSSSDTAISKRTRVSRTIKSAVSAKLTQPKINNRAATAKIKKVVSPPVSKDREQGGDYLIEICGRHLNIYGQGALRFIDKAWNASKANDVNTIKFNYVNFNSVTGILNKVKIKFPNADHFVFKETNISYIGQLNALAEVQGLISLFIDPEGNPIVQKNWRSYAVYRLAHWGLKVINGNEISEQDIKHANDEYQSLSELVLWSLPDVLLQPLLIRLRIDMNYGVTEQNAKAWLMKADPALRSVVSKEALQWKKGAVSQEDLGLRQKAKQHISQLLDEMSNAAKKLRLLDQEWPTIIHEFIRNTLLDYSHLDMYMKQKIHELSK